MLALKKAQGGTSSLIFSSSLNDDDFMDGAGDDFDMETCA
jgi:hypothetical protein